MSPESPFSRFRPSDLLAWLAPFGLSLYMKMVVLVQSGVCLKCYQLSGQSAMDKFGELSFFRHDFLLGLFVVPAGLLLLQRRLSPRASLSVAAIVSALMYIWLFAQLQSFQSVGTFVSPGLLRDAVVWGWENPHRRAAYLTRYDQLLLAAGAGWIALAWLHGVWRLRYRTPNQHVGITRRASRIFVILLTIMLALPWIPRVQETPYHRSMLSFVIRPTNVGNAIPRDEFEGMSTSELVQSYRTLSASPAPTRDTRYWASMKDADVLFFVFETGPAEALPIDGDLANFPTLRKLRDRSFVAASHYSTAPFTNRAWLSIFSSWYPSPFNFDAAFDRGSVPGVVRRAAEAGYQTALYSHADPHRMVPGDGDRLRAIGFQQIKSTPQFSGPNDVEAEMRREQQTVEILKQDMVTSIREGRRFLAAFLPLVGHGPWPDPTNGTARSVLDRGRALMSLQDDLLGQLVEELANSGYLDRTLIVVTSDHGIRTRMEDPDFPIGMIDRITFNVPFLVFAPRALSATTVIPWVTSHIDIAPTVLDLLGIERNTDGEQGRAIWNSGLTNRTTFQAARPYLGSDGLSRSGRFVMYRYLTDRVFEASRMRFEPTDEVQRESAASRNAIELFHRFSALQSRWMIAKPGALPR